MTKAFDMFDITDEEFDKIYNENKEFFYNLRSWFYFKNDKKTSGQYGIVRFGDCNGGIGMDDDPRVRDGAAALICNTADLAKLQKECEKSEDGLLRFKLKDGKTDAYLGIIKNLDGTKSAGFAVVNNQGTKYMMPLPFSWEGSSMYIEAKDEERTLPYMVENNKFVEMIPDDTLLLMGLKKRDSIAEIDEKIAYHTAQIEALIDQRRILKSEGIEK